MQLFFQQSLVPRVQPQLPQTIFSMPGIRGKRAKSRFLAPCSTWSALHPSLSPRAVFLVCLPAQSQVSQAGGLSWGCPHTSYLAQNVQCPSSHKDLDYAYGAGGLETSVVVWEKSTEPSILSCREMLRTSQGWFPVALQQPPFSAQVLLGKRLAPPQMTCFHGLPCWGVGEEP